MKGASPHPCAAKLHRDDAERAEDQAYLRKLGVSCEAGALVEALEAGKPKSAMPVMCHCLADLGAAEALPVLQRLAEFPVQDVKAASVLAVARLRGSEATPWLVECLSRKGTLKGYVLWALAAVGDARAAAAVEAWFEPELRKLERNPDADPRGNAAFAVAYLEQVADRSPEARALLARFELIAPRLSGSLASGLATFTTTYGQR